ncbi:unnamed protein product [Pleuronectes platessa]|uniref:Uncharacterized protein n=1 Tax=Pleuronectes platessa TaxID=8262 RepID=A0A9N7VPF5_PLEPL|nr:unnamed protein product [Pleuronectes platessa]
MAYRYSSICIDARIGMTNEDETTLRESDRKTSSKFNPTRRQNRQTLFPSTETALCVDKVSQLRSSEARRTDSFEHTLQYILHLSCPRAAGWGWRDRYSHDQAWQNDLKKSGSIRRSKDKCCKLRRVSEEGIWVSE